MTCADCRHADLERLKLSNQGRAAPCLERARLANGKGAIQEVPLKMLACSLFSERPDKTAAFAFADERLAQQLTEKRAKIDTWRAAIDRTTREIRELELARHEGKPEPVDPQWAGFEPDPLRHQLAIPARGSTRALRSGHQATKGKANV